MDKLLSFVLSRNCINFCPIFYYIFLGDSFKKDQTKSMSIPLYIAAGYAATSIFFFCFPDLLHKRKTYSNEAITQALQGKRILRICHRGAPRYTTENTVEGFRKVIHETDMLEMDVCETKDKVLVVHHDHSLRRTCGVDKFVGDLNFEELPKFKDEIDLDFAVNKTIPSNNQKIPTLEKVFQLFQGVPMDIQLKTPTESSIKEINRLINEYDRREITFVGIRNKMQDELRKVNPSLQLFFNDFAVFKLLILYFTGLLPFFPIEDASLQIPLYTAEFHEWKRQTLSPDKHFKLNCFFLAVKFFNSISRPLIWHLQQRGIMTMFWVCNEEEHFARAIKLGGQGIMTDDPYLLSEYLKKNFKPKVE